MEDSVKKAIADRDNAIIRQAFELGDQDRKIRDLEAKVAEQGATIDKCQVQLVNAGFQIDSYKAKVAELQAGDVGRLRQSVDFQAMEIQRLKAALWYGGKLDQVLIDILGTRPLGHESEDGLACWCDPDMDKAIAAKLDAYKGKVAALTEDLAERDRLLRECQAERETLRSKVAELEAKYKTEREESRRAHITVNVIWDRVLKTRKRARLAEDEVAELEAEVGALKGDAMIKTHYAAGLMDSVKALDDDLATAKKWLAECQAERDEVKAAAKRGTDEAKRLAAIAEYSNNLAQTRLEEAAKLRKEVTELNAAADEWRKAAEESVAEMRAANESGQRNFEKLKRVEALLGTAST